MRIKRWPVAILLSTAVSFAGQSNEADTPKRGGVAGIVIENKSGDPVRKALVILRRDEMGGTATTSDASGKFSFHDIEPGAYTITVERNGFVPARDSEHKSVVVKGGDTVTDLKLGLLRTGAISGRVFDADGDPVTGAGVQVQPIQKKNGRSFASTDDRGEYRAFNIAPGEYRVSATYARNPDRMDLRMQKPAGPDGIASSDAYPAVYYPGTTDMRQAGVLSIEPAADLKGIDLHLVRAHAVHVRGRIAKAGGGSLGLFAVVGLSHAGRRTGMDAQNQSALVRDSKGEFDIADVLPGAYRVNATTVIGENRLTGNRTIEVADSDLDNVDVLVGPPQPVKGRILAPEGRKIPAGLMIVLGARDTDSTESGGMSPVASDGTFNMKDVMPGDYDVMVVATETLAPGASDDLYVSAIKMGDADALADGVHVGDGAVESVDIILKANGATVECGVKNETGDAVPGAHVTLLPDEPRRHQLALYGECKADAKGVCNITGITPGEYHLYAVPNGAEINYRDPDELKPLEKLGVAVKVAEGDKQQVELRPAPVE